MTDQQQDGPAPDIEATASTDHQAPEQSVAAVAVADEPATTSETPAIQPAAQAAPEAAAPEAVADAEAPAAVAAVEAPAEPEVIVAPEATAPEASPTAETPDASLSPAHGLDSSEDAAQLAAELADAPAAAEDEEPEPIPVRELGPEPTTMEELLAEQDSDIKSFKHGDVVEGTVVRIDKDEILVDIGAKSEGVVSNRELYGRNAESSPPLAVGDTVLVYVLQPESQEGHVVLSLRRAGLERKWR